MKSVDVCRILVDVLRTGVSPTAVPIVSGWTADPAYVARFVVLAEQHAVEPLVFASLERHDTKADYSSLKAELAALHQTNAFRNLALAAELVALCRRFAAKQILAVPLKGPALAAVAYGDVGLRAFVDLDLFVRREQVIPARDVLREAGFEMYSKVHHSADSALLRSINAEFTMCRGNTSVDLHWRVLPDFFPFHLDSESLWADVTTQRLAGHQLPAFSPEHQLLYLAAHGAKHYWAKLRWVCDFAKYLQAVPLDWTRALDLAHAAGKPLMLTHALALVRKLFQLELPAGAERLVDTKAEEIAERTISWILTAEGQRPGTRDQVWFLSQFTSGFGDTIRLWHGITVAPTEAEWSLVQLPAGLYPLYYPIRLGRMALKYCPGIGSTSRKS